MTDFSQRLRDKWQTILVIIFAVTAITFSVSAFLPAQYLSEVSILVIQKQTINKVDAFSAAKSAEYLSEILSQVIYSQSFLEDVLTAPFENKKTFSSDITQRELEWKKTVEANKVNNTGIVKIKVYAQSKIEAESTAQSIAWALAVRGHKYHGGGDWVKIVTIDGPSTADAPAKPNLLLNTLLGFILGVAGALAVVYFLEDFNLIIFRPKARAILTKEKIAFDLKNKVEKISPIFLQEGKLSGEMLKKALNYSQAEDYRPFIKKTPFSALEIFKKKEEAAPVVPVQEKEPETETIEPIKESVRVIEPESFSGANYKKAPAPDNLPIFQEEEEELAAEFENVEQPKETKEELRVGKNGFIDLKDLARAMEKKDLPSGAEEEGGEPSEEEVRNRLNRLLKGDL